VLCATHNTTLILYNTLNYNEFSENNEYLLVIFDSITGYQSNLSITSFNKTNDENFNNSHSKYFLL